MTNQEKEKIISGRNTSSYYMEVSKNGKFSVLTINGIRSVDEFSDDKTILKLSRGKVVVSGEKLRLSIYENGGVGILGIVKAVEFI